MLSTVVKYIDPDVVAGRYLSVKVKLSIILAYTIFGIWLATTALPWYWMLVCFYTSVLMLRVGAEVGYHRYFAHRSFETTVFKKRLLLILGSIMGVGSCISWAAVHRTHHRYSDTDRDPHSPKNIGVVRVWLTMWDDNWHAEPNVVKDLIRDPWQVFFHKHYFKLLIFWIAVWSVFSYLVGTLTPLAVMFAIPCATTSFFSGITNGLGHWQGYRNFETEDNSRNHHWTRWMFVTVGLHNNHHNRPNDWNFNTLNNWYEFDVEAFLIKYFFMKTV